MILTKYPDNTYSGAIIGHNKNFDNGFSLESIHLVQNLSLLKLSNLEIDHQNVFMKV